MNDFIFASSPAESIEYDIRLGLESFFTSIYQYGDWWVSIDFLNGNRELEKPNKLI